MAKKTIDETKGMFGVDLSKLKSSKGKSKKSTKKTTKKRSKGR